MTPNQVKDFIKADFAADVIRPLYLEGPPGCGKTSVPEQVARELGIGFKLLYAPLMKPEDTGYPIVNAARTAVNMALVGEPFPLEGTDYPEQGILVIDELAQGEPDVQKTMGHLMQAREMHGRRLKPGWKIIATGNRAKDRAGASRLFTHLRSRMSCVPFEPNLDETRKYMLAAGAPVEVVGFLSFCPDAMMDFDPSREWNTSPRTWLEGVAPRVGNTPPGLEFEVYASEVGEGHATKFIAFLKTYRSLPDMDKVLANPDKAKAPPADQPDVLYAISAALAHRANEDNLDRLIRYAEKMPPEFMVRTIKDVVSRKPVLAMQKAFSDFALKHVGLFSAT